MIFIDNFEQEINYVIVGRGKNYFQNGAITEFKMNNNEVYAVVSGTEDYEVNMQIDDSGNIISSYCDCPYDMGEFCKHEVAVMYAIREFCNNNNNLKSSKNTLEELLLSQPIDYQYFIKSNRNEAIDMYFKECIKKASTLSGRSSYNRLCTAISDFGKCYGSDVALKIIECLKINHKRQPAFIDELCSIERKMKNFHRK